MEAQVAAGSRDAESRLRVCLAGSQDAARGARQFAAPGPRSILVPMRMASLSALRRALEVAAALPPAPRRCVRWMEAWFLPGAARRVPMAPRFVGRPRGRRCGPGCARVARVRCGACACCSSSSRRHRLRFRARRRAAIRAHGGELAQRALHLRSQQLGSALRDDARVHDDHDHADHGAASVDGANQYRRAQVAQIESQRSCGAGIGKSFGRLQHRIVFVGAHSSSRSATAHRRARHVGILHGCGPVRRPHAPFDRRHRNRQADYPLPLRVCPDP